MERFDAYMERCLYGADGFYRTAGTAGRRRGDFITSPEVGPLFGAVLASALDARWDDAGQPDDWTVYDVGCGPNALLKAIRRARPMEERPWRLVGIDRVHGGADGSTPPSPDRGIERAVELPDDLSNAVVVANELLDNMPFRIIEHSASGEWFEIHVDNGVERRCGTEARLDIPAGTRAPWLEQADRWCRSVIERQPARLLVFDYGATTTARLARRGGWLRTYQSHRRGTDPLYEPGRWDITTDIAVDQLPAPHRVMDQRRFLIEAGIEGLVDEGREHWKAHAHRPDITAMMMRSRVSEADALLDPDGLGSWLVLEWGTSLATTRP